VVLEDLEARLNERGLLLGHDPWSRPIATLGGAISTNGMGYLAGRYGSMGDQVLGLEVVLATGEIVTTRAVPKASGPALDSLFIGAEGTLGVITRATIEAFPVPERRGLHAYRFGGFEAGFDAVQGMYAVGLRPAMVDFAEELPAGSSPDATDSETTLYLGFEGFEEEAAAQEVRADRLCRRAGGKKLDGSEAQGFWDARHESAERYKREVLQGPASQRRRRSAWRMDYLHLAVPASRILEYHRYCRGLLLDRGIPVREWSLWGRPEFFSLLIVDPTPADQDDRRMMVEAVDDLLVAAQDLGGSMEYCHGVGLKLSHLMEREMGGGMAALRRIKGALDPQGILNAGKLGLS
jgi:alkyldihydroxyacetonephosphate synthase